MSRVFLFLLLGYTSLKTGEGKEQEAVNVALGKPTRQSGTAYGGEASRAVDGNTDGIYRGNSVTHTPRMSNPSWTVDLETNCEIEEIAVYGRIDSGSEELSGFEVNLYNDDEVVWTYTHSGTSIPDPVTRLTVPSKIGNKVEVRIPGDEKILSLAEVEVSGRTLEAGTNGDVGSTSLKAVNVALGKPTTQSGTAYDGEASRAVDGNTDGMYRSNSVTHTPRMSNPSWTVDLETKYEIEEISVYGRTDYGSEELSGFEVNLYNDDEVVWTYTHSGTSIPDPVTRLIVPSKIGNKVEVRIPGDEKILSLAEVEVSGRTLEAGTNGDPIILGLKDQVFKFEGRDGAWYSNLSSENIQWNMQFKEFNSCPAEENMFISGMSISTSDKKDKAIKSDILIATTPEPIAECREDPNLVCLGEGTLHLSFDGGKTFVSQPGDYHFSSHSRVVAHNTYAACSRKWHDYEVSASETSGLRDGGRRATVQEKKPLQLLSDKKLTMIDPSGCSVWIEDRKNKNDLFQQRGHWSTMYIETPLVSFHIEYRRSDWFDPKCDFQSLDAWMTKISDKMEKTEWHGILGETKTKIYDLMTGKQIKTDRSKILRGKEDSDYEVTGPFDTKFAALGKHNGFNKVISSIIESVSK